MLSHVEESFKSIKETTQIDNIEDLINMFEETETWNFSILKYVDQLNLEIWEIEDEIKIVKSEIQKYEDKDKNVSKKEVILEQLKEKLEATEAENKVYEEQYTQTMNVIRALKLGIQNIFNRIGCNNQQV